MKRLYLASSINVSAIAIAKDIGGDPSKMKLAFINTAAEGENGSKEWMDSDKKGLVDSGFDLFDYTITGKSTSDINRDLGGCEIIHINGGNTFYLLDQMKKTGFDKWVKEKIDNGVIYMGSSAGIIVSGANVEYAKSLDDSKKAPNLKDFSGLNLIDLNFLVHWGSHFNPEERKKIVIDFYKEDLKLVVLNNYQYIKVVDDIYKIVDAREQ